MPLLGSGEMHKLCRSMGKHSKEVGLLAKGAPGPRILGGEIVEQTAPVSLNNERDEFFYCSPTPRTLTIFSSW